MGFGKKSASFFFVSFLEKIYGAALITCRILKPSGKVLPFLAAGFILALLPLLMQYLHLLDLKETLQWVKVHKGAYRVNTAIIVFLFLCFYALFNSIFPAISTVMIFCLTFSIVDMQKMRILHQPLLPADLLFVKQALLIARIYAGQVLSGCLTLAALAIGTFLMRKKLPRCSLPFLPRIALVASLCTALYFCVGRFHHLVTYINKRQKICNEFWNQLSNFRKNGVLYGFLLNIESLRVSRPPHYGKEAIERIFREDSNAVKQPGKPDVSRYVGQKPDVIVYVNESFWDITQISSIKLSRDPLPAFHSRGRRFRRTKLVSPVFGGNTCIAEFDFLTGMSHGYLPPGSIAYNQFINRPIPSMVRVFKENGYRATAIHSYKKWFWNRHNVYRHMGFDTFVSVESMDEPRLKGTYVSDAELVKYILRCVDSSGGPNFIFALSMQNHGPYDYKRYDTLDYRVTTGLSQAADREYNNFLQGLIDADRSLRMVLDHIRNSRKPILLLFFGDHLPGFTHLYKETGYESAIEKRPLLRYTTSGLWYANYQLTNECDSIISMVYLPILVARMAGIEVPAYYRFLDILRSEYPIFTGGKRLDADGKPIASDAHTLAQDKACRILIYDALFGKGFAERFHHVENDRSNIYVAGIGAGR